MHKKSNFKNVIIDIVKYPSVLLFFSSIMCSFMFICVIFGNIISYIINLILLYGWHISCLWMQPLWTIIGVIFGACCGVFFCWQLQNNISAQNFLNKVLHTKYDE